MENGNSEEPIHLAFSYKDGLHNSEPFEGQCIHSTSTPPPETLPPPESSLSTLYLSHSQIVSMGNQPATLHHCSNDRSSQSLHSSSCPQDRRIPSQSSSSSSYSTTLNREPRQQRNVTINPTQHYSANISLQSRRVEEKHQSNLSVILNQNEMISGIGKDNGQDSCRRPELTTNEADSASGPACWVQEQQVILNDTNTSRRAAALIPPRNLSSSVPDFSPDQRDHNAIHTNGSHYKHTDSVIEGSDNNVRRCMSNKELGQTFVPNANTGSPYAFMLYQREVLEATMQQRLMAIRETTSSTPSPAPTGLVDTEKRHTTGRLTNETRNRRRAEHTNAVIHDLCEIVTDLFVAESKLLNLSRYGVQSSHHRAHVSKSVQQFLSALPSRYALGVNTPSEVLLHMRLMAAARSDRKKAVVHICNHEGERLDRATNITKLVTISCADARGLLEYISNLLSTGGSRVIDADVMLTSDNIVLDRFVVEMNGRLRLDKLANGIESFLKQKKAEEASDGAQTSSSPSRSNSQSRSSICDSPSNSPSEKHSTGPVYFHPSSKNNSPREIQEEMKGAVPLTHVLNSSNNLDGDLVPVRGRSFPKLTRLHSMPNPKTNPINLSPQHPDTNDRTDGKKGGGERQSTRQRRPLVNREAFDFGGMNINENIETQDIIPSIPFEELMLIETLGMGRVSTIYRAAWQRRQEGSLMNPKMVALKVASVNPGPGDLAHINELQHEADIAAMLHHPNVCALVGRASDPECFCLAYEFCEGGSLLSLLTDTTRYYEYLPIALDICNGMAYLHSRNVIHRDLKPSNVLLTRDHRAKISDFGMSVANKGQELTAETGTYRYMSPEVIRHESYSSNADVYSFGVLLWQLITREVPFATMTPIQAAYSVAEGRRPKIPDSCPERLRDIISACWDPDSHKRPSFTYIAMALADYAKMSFNPANVGAQTLSIANEMLENVNGNSTVNVDFSTPVAALESREWFGGGNDSGGSTSSVGLEI